MTRNCFLTGFPDLVLFPYSLYSSCSSGSDNPLPQRCQLIPITLRPKSEVFMKNIKALPKWPLATSLTYCLWVFSTAVNLLQAHLFALPWRPTDMFLLQGFCTCFALCMESTSQDSLPQTNVISFKMPSLTILCTSSLLSHHSILQPTITFLLHYRYCYPVHISIIFFNWLSYLVI